MVLSGGAASRYDAPMAKRKRKSSRQSPPETPTCNCALLCDDVVMSAKGKHTLVGIIGMITVPRLPAVLGGYVTYVRISNVYGNQKVRISLEHAKSGESVFEFEVPLQQQDPLGVHTVIAPIPVFEVEEAGRYVFQAESRGEPLAQSPIMVMVADGGQGVL